MSITHIGIVGWVVAMAAGGCGSIPKPQAKATITGVGEFLEPHRGNVVVLLAGRQDCPGTITATVVLDGYARGKPPDVHVLRVDVPLPDERYTPAGWDHPYPRYVDERRQLADQLDFFYYPTLYIFDRDGVQRFAGGCDPQRLAEIVAQLRAEPPGAPKTSFDLPMPEVGKPAPAFSATTLDDKPVTLQELLGRRGTLLIFARTSCRYTRDALPGVKTLADHYAPHGVAVVLVNDRQEKEQLRTIYAQRAPGLQVVWDRTGQISRAYGVDVSPFYFLVDAKGTIVKRRSYSLAAASGSLNSMLALGSETPRYPSSKAG